MQETVFQRVKVSTNNPAQPGYKGYLLLPNLKVKDSTWIANVQVGREGTFKLKV